MPGQLGHHRVEQLGTRASSRSGASGDPPSAASAGASAGGRRRPSLPVPPSPPGPVRVLAPLPTRRPTARSGWPAGGRTALRPRLLRRPHRRRPPRPWRRRSPPAPGEAGDWSGRPSRMPPRGPHRHPPPRPVGAPATSRPRRGPGHRPWRGRRSSRRPWCGARAPLPPTRPGRLGTARSVRHGPTTLRHVGQDLPAGFLRLLDERLALPRARLTMFSPSTFDASMISVTSRWACWFKFPAANSASAMRAAAPTRSAPAARPPGSRPRGDGGGGLLGLEGDTGGFVVGISQDLGTLLPEGGAEVDSSMTGWRCPLLGLGQNAAELLLALLPGRQFPGNRLQVGPDLLGVVASAQGGGACAGRRRRPPRATTRSADRYSAIP